jgi:hypothetical protein
VLSPTKKAGQFHFHLRPQCSGVFTQWQIIGSVPTVVPSQKMRRFIRELSFWSGWPVKLVLSAEVETADWLECWTDALTEIPEDHLELRFILKRPPKDKLP